MHPRPQRGLACGRTRARGMLLLTGLGQLTPLGWRALLIVSLRSVQEGGGGHGFKPALATTREEAACRTDGESDTQPKSDLPQSELLFHGAQGCMASFPPFRRLPLTPSSHALHVASTTHIAGTLCELPLPTGKVFRTSALSMLEEDPMPRSC